MKVIHLSCVAPPQTGGIGSVASMTVELLKARGMDATLIAPSNMPTMLSLGNAAILERWRLRKITQDADIVHLHYPFYGTAGFIAKLRRERKITHLVLTLHMDAMAEGLKGRVFDLHRQLLQSPILHSADALLVSSKDYAAHSSFAPWKDRVVELPFGVDGTRFTPRTIASGKTVVFVGGMDRAHAHKGVDVLLRAFAELPRDAKLVLAGDGALRSRYERRARALGVADRTSFIGRVDDAELPDVYRQGAVLAFPATSRAEAFGLVALEAQACGIPVVASDLPGVRTVVEDKTTGLLTPPGNAKDLAAHLRLLLDNPGMCEKFGRAARQRVLDRFKWRRHIDGLIKVYSRVRTSRS